jgi:hypothetical protein
LRPAIGGIVGRPERHDADYFPFYVKDGKTLFILESKYGLQGIGFFTNLMRFLTRQTDHHICIQDESDRLYFFAQIRCPEDLGMDMIGLMVKTGKLDQELWLTSRVIVSQDLLDSLQDAYKNRNNPIIEIAQIRLSYQVNKVSYQDNLITSPDKPQRKGKERKGKDIGETQFPEWLPKDTWEAFIEMRKSIKANPTEKAIELLIGKLDKLKMEGNDPKCVLEASIENNWKGLFPLKTGGKKDGGIRNNRSDPRDKNLQSRTDAQCEALTRQWEASQETSGGEAARASGNDDAPDFQAR